MQYSICFSDTQVNISMQQSSLASMSYFTKIQCVCVCSKSVLSKSVFLSSVFSESVFSESVFSKSVFSKGIFSESVFSESIFIKSVFFEIYPTCVSSKLCELNCSKAANLCCCVRMFFLRVFLYFCLYLSLCVSLSLSFAAKQPMQYVFSKAREC